MPIRALLATVATLAAVGSSQLAHGSSAAPAAPAVILEVTSSPVPLRACASATWRFRVVNRSDTPAQLRFRSGQRGDIVLRREAGGAAVYRWSETRGFTLALWQRAVVRGRPWSFALRDLVRAPAGRYLMTVSVTASSSVRARLVVRRWIAVTGTRMCEIAHPGAG